MVAVGSELQRRHVKPGVFCIACGREETIIHRMWRCPHSLLFWKSLSKAVETPMPMLPKYVEGVQNMRSWILGWLASAPAEEKRQVMRAWYELWLASNNAWDNAKIEAPMLIAERVLRLDAEWQSIKEPPRRTQTQRT